MRLEDIQKYREEKTLEYPDLENMFNIYERKNKYMLNINSTMYLDIPEDQLKYHIVTHDMFWPTISWILYKSTRFAWVLMKLNGVKSSDVFKKVKASYQIKYVNRVVLDRVIEALKKED